MGGKAHTLQHRDDLGRALDITHCGKGRSRNEGRTSGQKRRLREEVQADMKEAEGKGENQRMNERMNESRCQEEALSSSENLKRADLAGWCAGTS